MLSIMGYAVWLLTLLCFFGVESGAGADDHGSRAINTELGFHDNTNTKTKDSHSASVRWRAVYDMIFDEMDMDGYDFSHPHYTISGNGRKVAVTMKNGTSPSRKVVVMDTDGSNAVTYVPPDDHGFVSGRSLVMDYDGSRTFVSKYARADLFKLEGGVVTKLDGIADYEEWPSYFEEPQQLRTTDNGAYVYFSDSRDIWRISHNGAGLSKVIETANVPLNEQTGEIDSIEEYDVSADGSIIAFLAEKQYDAKEVFVLQSGEYDQLTSDGTTHKNDNLAISGDGSTIVYDPYNETDYYTAIAPDGSNSRHICESGYNFAGFSLTANGFRMLYNDNLAGGGRLANTSGSSVFNLMPEDLLWITDLGGMSADGARICFCQRYESHPARHRLYVGYLKQSGVVSNEPQVSSVNYEPAFAPKDQEDASIISTFAVTAAEGVSDVTIRLISNGMVIDADEPLDVWKGPRDDGVSPDETAGDGIYTVEYRTTNATSNYDQVTIRIGVRDMAHTIAVVDTVLFIGERSAVLTPLPLLLLD